MVVFRSCKRNGRRIGYGILAAIHRGRTAETRPKYQNVEVTNDKYCRRTALGKKIIE